MSDNVETDATEVVAERTVKVDFVSHPPEHGKVAMIPKEALYPFLAVVPIAVIIIALMTNFLLTLGILIPFAIIAFVGYMFTKKYLEENHAPYAETFFEPIREAFQAEETYLSNHQIAYLWNYKEVRLSPSKKIYINNDWANGAFFTIVG